jgi:hypothetical protein
MLFAFALILAAVAGGATITYLYDDDAPFAARVCMGSCTGLAVLGLVGFVFSSFLGLTMVSLVLSAAVAGSPLLLLANRDIKRRAQADLRSTTRAVRRAILHPDAGSSANFIFYLLVIVMLYFFFDRAVIETGEGIFTGAANNLGDLPFHFASITSFVYGQNFPPEDPSFAGTSFAYPFIADFVAAMLMRAGASMRDSMLMQNMVLAISLVGVLHRWTLNLTRDRLAGFLAPVLMLFSGGVGWLILLNEAREREGGVVGMLLNLRHDYSILGGNVWRWGNALTTLFITQRSILFGLPIAIVIFTQWWAVWSDTREVNIEKGKGKKKEAAAVSSTSLFPTSFLLSFKSRRMIAAGVMAGLLLLVHAHTFLTVMGVAACLAILRDDRRAWYVMFGFAGVVSAISYFWPSLSPFLERAVPQTSLLRITAGLVAVLGLGIPLAIFAYQAWKKNQWPWREWVLFFAAALLLSVPQMLWVMSGSSVEAKSFIGFHFGWDKGADVNFVVFWLKNLGLFIPLLIGALLWQSDDEYFIERRWLIFYLPFTLCFIGSNVVKLAPWPWDNIKVLFYWYVASLPIVSLVLARMWRGEVWRKVLMMAVLLSLTAAGALDVWRIASRQINEREYEPDAVRLADKIIQTTPPRSLILHAPTYNPVVFLTGRRSLLGYTGYIWAHGLDYVPRENDIKRIYSGAYDAKDLLKLHNVDYVVVTPTERAYMPVNDQFFQQFPLAAEVGDHKLYKVR